MFKYIINLFFIFLSFTIVINGLNKNIKNYNVYGEYPCIICRSPGVESYPDLFMLPKNQILNLPVFDGCNNPTNLPNTSYVVNCDKYCTSIAIECPNPTVCTEKYLYIRGCQNTLTQNIQPNVSDSDLDKNNQYCEYDSGFLAYKVNGNPINLEYIASLCLSNIQDPNNKQHCNDYLSPTSKYPISQLKNSCNALKSSRNIPCYKCDDEEKNCRSGSDGSQTYCYKRYMKVGSDNYYVVKGSSNINPYFTNNFCYDDTTTYSLSSFISVPAKRGVCFCSDKDYCNGSNEIYYMKKQLIIVTIFVFLSFFF